MGATCGVQGKGAVCAVHLEGLLPSSACQRACSRLRPRGTQAGGRTPHPSWRRGGWRLLRSVRVETTGREPRAELVKMVRFHLDCDDNLFDKSRMPKRLQGVQIAQACILVPVWAPESAHQGIGHRLIY